jgi:hypothetical protein
MDVRVIYRSPPQALIRLERALWRLPPEGRSIRGALLRNERYPIFATAVSVADDQDSAQRSSINPWRGKLACCSPVFSRTVNKINANASAGFGAPAIAAM